MVPRIVDKEEKKQQIFEAALGLFAQKGVDRTTIQEIADAAGVGKGTIYEYFSGKDDILAVSFDYIKEKSDAFLAEKLDGITNPVDKLKSTLEGFVLSFQTLPEDSWEILLVFWAEGILHSPRDDREDAAQLFDLRSMYKEYNEFMVSILEEGKATGVFRKDINSYELAAALIGFLDGLMLQWLLLKDHIDINSAVYQLVKVVLRGISADEESE